jgi:CubicO group peptidase (beta-lactamase class C family)
MKRIFIYIFISIFSMIIWAALVFIGTLNGSFHQCIANDNATSTFEEAANKEATKAFTGNFAMAIIKNGNVELETFQTAGAIVNRTTVFQVASLSKWITAFGIMSLVEDGTLDLDAPVSKYLTRWKLPQSQYNNDEVTVRRLLSHTAGLTDGLGYSGFEDSVVLQSIEQSLTKALDADDGVNGIVSVGMKPGTSFKYSGGGYTLLQLLVEEVTGRSFALYMKQSVLEPLGMIHSTYVWNNVSDTGLAEFYNADGTKAKHYRYTALAATSLYTSLSDMELFFQAHFEGKHGEPAGRNVLKPETIAMMRVPHGTQMGVDIWGLGTVLYLPIDGGDFIIGHDGKSSPPINTAVRLNPATGDGIIVLETGNPGLATKLASEWVFWKTGKVDTLLFLLLLDQMIAMIVTGWVVLVIVVTIYAFIKRRTNSLKSVQ